MSKFFLTFFVYLSIILGCYGSWLSITPPDSSVDYVTSAWISQSTVILAGNRFEYGTLLKSTNGGLSWTIKLQYVNRIFDVAYISYSNVNYVLAVTDSGDIYYSTNAGETWTVGITVTASLYGVTIGSNGIAYAAGIRSMYPTSAAIYSCSITSGSTTWTALTVPSLPSAQLNDITTFDGVNVIAVGAGGLILTSSNSGSSWTIQTSSTTNDIYGVSCASSSFAMAAGMSATLLVTSNGGITWSSLQSRILGAGGIQSSSNFQFHSVYVLSSSVAYVASSNGYVAYTLNGGSSWTLDSARLGSTLYCISMYNQAIGVSGAARGAPIFTRIAAPTSQPSSQPSSQPIRQPTNQPTSQPSGQPSCQPSSQPLSQPTSQPSRQPSNRPTAKPSIYFRYPSSVPSMLPSGQPTSAPSSSRPSSRPSSSAPTSRPTGYLAPSVWATSPTGAAANLLWASAWSSQSNVVMVGEQFSNGVAVRSSNGGASWSTTLFSGMKLKDVATYQGYFVAVSAVGCVFVSVDAGNAWSSCISVQAAVHGVSIGSNGRAFAVGSNSVVLTSTASQGFATWLSINPNNVPSVLLNAVSTKDGVSLYAVGNGGAIYTSSNAGGSWVTRASGTTSTLFAVASPSASFAIAVGLSAAIVRTTNRGVTWTSLQAKVIGVAGIASNTNFRYRAIAMLNPAVGFLSTSNGLILRTVNGGNTWTVDTNIAASATFGLYSLSMYNKQVGAAADSNGIAYIKSTTLTPLPTGQPTSTPSASPTSLNIAPTPQPTLIPTFRPSPAPTNPPSPKPSSLTGQPSMQPTAQPSGQPTRQPTQQPFAQPSMQPFAQPSMQPSIQPSMQPSIQPSIQPSMQPTLQPTSQPSSQPTFQPSSQPTGQPTSQPTMQPSGQPSRQPSSQPTSQPSSQPSFQPSNQPTSRPTNQPTFFPTAQPTFEPTTQPSQQPTVQPSGFPTRQPSSQPSTQPTGSPVKRQPSSHPTSVPSTLYQIQNKFSVLQTFKGLPPLQTAGVQLVVRQTLATIMSSLLTASAISINSATTANTTQSMMSQQGYLRKDRTVGMTLLASEHEVEPSGPQRSIYRRLSAPRLIAAYFSATAAPSQIALNYTVSYIIQRIGYSRTADAYSGLSQALQQSVNSGQCTVKLRATATARGLGSLFSNAACGSIQRQSPVTTQLVLHTSRAPTHQPTYIPKAVQRAGKRLMGLSVQLFAVAWSFGSAGMLALLGGFIFLCFISRRYACFRCFSSMKNSEDSERLTDDESSGWCSCCGPRKNRTDADEDDDDDDDDDEEEEDEEEEDDKPKKSWFGGLFGKKKVADEEDDDDEDND